MRTSLKLAAIVGLVVTAASAPTAARVGTPALVGPALASIGPLAFGPDGMLYAADTQAATIFALDLGAQARGAVAGTMAVENFDQKVAALLGTAAAEIRMTDLAVHPASRNSFVAVMRGQGAGAQAALVRVDGAGKIDLVTMDSVKFTSVGLPNPVAATTTGRSNRAQAITDMAFLDGRLFIAGLSNEEFASKLWTVPYPFAAANNGTSVEIFHGAHGALETRSPILTFVPQSIGGQPMLIAGYTCTPLVRFPVSDLKPGSKVMGTTIAELGAGNRPIDMIVYKKDGQEFLLMANSSRGVMKIPTAGFGSAAPITAKVADKAGTSYETIAAMAGVEQLDMLNATTSVVLARLSGGLSLQTVALP
jgi:hypothetical protein